MRFSLINLLICTSILAAVLGVGYPALKFAFYDKVNFAYDRDQTIEYVESATSGKRRRRLIEATSRLSARDDGKILIVEASLANGVIHVELISTTFHQPESLDIELDSGDTVSVDTHEIQSTGTYYFYGNIPVTDKIPDTTRIMSIRFSNRESRSNYYSFSEQRSSG